MKFNVILYILFILIYVLLSVDDVYTQVTCPPGYQIITIDFYRVVTRASDEKCYYQNPSLCHFRAYYCVRCDVTAPRLDIFLRRIEIAPLGGNQSEGYLCHCQTMLYDIIRSELLMQEAMDELFAYLLETNFCGLRVCGGNPPSETVEVSFKEMDCYKFKYEPVDCIGPVSIDYDCEGSGYCEKIYRVCVKFD